MYSSRKKIRNTQPIYWDQTVEWKLIFLEKSLQEALSLLLKLRRMKAKQAGTGRRFKKVANKPRNRHHLFPKCRGGDYSTATLLLISTSKHAAWHKLFRVRGQDMTLGEIIDKLAQSIARLREASTALFVCYNTPVCTI